MTDPKKSSTGTLTKPSDREIHLERIFNAPRKRVWAAFTDPALIPQLWGAVTVVEAMDVRPGGQWRFAAEYPNGSRQAHHGTYQEVTPPERIVTTFQSDAAPGVHTETSTFEDMGDRTGFTITLLFDTTEERDTLLSYGAEHGMNQTYSRLDELLAGGVGHEVDPD